MLTIIIIVYATALDCIIMAKINNNAQNPFLETLRRQLMEDNYDYQSIEKAEGSTGSPTEYTPSPDDRSSVVKARVEEPADNPDDNRLLEDDEARKVVFEAPPKSHEFKVRDKVVGLDVLSLQNFKRPHFRSGTWEEPVPNKNNVVSKTDLLYYVDENQLRRRHGLGEVKDPLNHGTNVDYEEMYPQDEDDVTTTPQVKYKVIKVRERSPNRRKAPAPRFLLEQGSQGVAFISLDAAPFPEFKLPRSRRQYMQDIGEELKGTNSDDDELSTSPDTNQINHDDI